MPFGRQHAGQESVGVLRIRLDDDLALFERELGEGVHLAARTTGARPPSSTGRPARIGSPPGFRSARTAASALAVAGASSTACPMPATACPTTGRRRGRRRGPGRTTMPAPPARSSVLCTASDRFSLSGSSSARPPVANGNSANPGFAALVSGRRNRPAPALSSAGLERVVRAGSGGAPSAVRGVRLHRAAGQARGVGSSSRSALTCRSHALEHSRRALAIRRAPSKSLWPQR